MRATADDEWLSFDVTDAVHQWLSGSGEHSPKKCPPKYPHISPNDPPSPLSPPQSSWGSSS